MTTIKALFFASIVAVLLPGMALAEDYGNPEYGNTGYLVDTRGNVVKNAFGECWRTGYWTPAMAIAECDPDLMKKAEAPAPKLVAAAEPAPQPAPQPVVLQKVSFSADVLFAFDKSTLKPEGKSALEGFVNSLSGTNYDSIHVTGHTDRLGSNKYNQKLSDRRANSARSYLITKGIPAERIVAEGMGETQPATKAGECTGRRARRSSLACSPTGAWTWK